MSAAPPPAPESETAAIGRRVRALREEQGVSLSALARSAGIGKATLSGLENGVRNPTLETLYAVTAQLGVPLGAVLAGPASAPSVRGAAVRATLLEVFTEAGATYELYRMSVVPGATQLSPAHRPGVTEHVTVFTGVLRAGPVDAPSTVAAGGYLRWTSDVPHCYAAVGDEEVTASLLLRYPGG
ncbi:helix-turn-helix domain-containing protein [Micromonospora sp. WMMD882]|uniref:helix-turn-helix domain-containing protein n=1 Tax=Micromonospora sp. WMMD882 TaxID=3015151 RepID=UPI00248B23B2|nr:helix-turn-helix domain-containing protein [Micromonospora sp. WMMD882]WBB78030.1 helix-turn-helix domain-containing protein [Micromonospora sp. WMMD882]